jgi:outer membrane protein OmpA-like peptidoglycan-associated protein
VAAATALVAALVTAVPSLAQQPEPDRLPVGDLTLPVSDLALTEASVDGTVRTTTSAGHVSVTVAADALFEPGRAALTPEGLRLLGDPARLIGAARPQEVVVEAHTDASGSPRESQELSRRQADAVAAALEEILGAAAPGFTPVGRGEREPVASDPARSALDRRVTIDFDR